MSSQSSSSGISVYVAILASALLFSCGGEESNSKPIKENAKTVRLSGSSSYRGFELSGLYCMFLGNSFLREVYIIMCECLY